MANVCAAVPAFDRLNYYYGQLLGAADFLAEQRYFREKLKLHNRCLHGHGVVCGLEVAPRPPATPPSTTPGLQLGCGLALDADGNELVVREPIDIPDLLALLSPVERAALPTTGGVPVWITLRYAERGISPDRPVLADACGGPLDCAFGRTREQVCVQATTTAPTADGRCATCCEPPPEQLGGLVLARIDGVVAGLTEILASDIHNDVRRALGQAPPTTITGINWTHGGSYVDADASRLLGLGVDPVGLSFRFSAPVTITETSPQGLIDAWLVRKTGAVLCLPGTLQWTLAPAPAGMATAVTYTASVTGAPTPEVGDRVAITLRSAFLLDACCRPISGAHVGGRVGPIDGGIFDPSVIPPATCTSPPGGSGSWTSGDGAAINFESWFFVRQA